MKVYDTLQSLGIDPQPVNYHGMFMKGDNFGRFLYKFIDEDVKRAFETRKNSTKFGL